MRSTRTGRGFVAASLCCLLLTAIGAGPAGATTLPPADPDAALERADTVALVRILAVAPEWRERTLVQRIRAEPRDARRPGRGDGETVAWVQPGGSAVDPHTGLRVRLIVPGLTTPRPGEEVLVLLVRPGPEPVLADPLLGILPVARDEHGQAWVRLPGRASSEPVARILATWSRDRATGDGRADPAARETAP
jgi:hypothetical protein